MTPDDPKTLGRFTILHPLGEGGMGKVYLARDPSMDRQVAIKTVLGSKEASPKLHERFMREAKAAGSLSHPNLVTIHDFGEDDGTVYIVMEYLPGLDLSSFLARRTLSPAEALDVMAQICDGLAYAHGKGVLHRDVKPTNVRVQRIGDRLHAKLMDFGVARLPGSQLTATGDLVGTFNYMAPEYLRSGEADARCDLYAVGMMLHEALMGELPSMAPTLPGAAAGAAETAQHPTLEGVSPHTWEIVEKALAPAARRFASASEMAAALRAAQNPHWGGLAEQELPKVKSLPGDMPMPSRAPSDDPAGKAVPFQPILRSEPAPEPRIAWWPIALVTLAGLAGIWAWQGRQPAAARPAPTEPTVSQPVASQDVRSAPSPNPNPDPMPVQSLAPSTDARPGPPPSQPPQRPAAPEPSRAVAELERLQAQVKDHPREAYEAAQDVLREQPAHPMAHACTVAALYWMGRVRDIPEALEALQRQRIEGRHFGAFDCIREMMRSERSLHRLPPDVMDRLKQVLPPPPEGHEPGDRDRR